MMRIREILTENEYQEYSAQAHELMKLDPDENTTEGLILDILVQMLEHYEKKHFYNRC